MDKFNFNPILININKLKPYKFIDDNTLQLVFAKPNDLTTEILVQKEILNVHVCNHYNNAPIHNY
jgi:ABC-type transport system substrate-binding protein